MTTLWTILQYACILAFFLGALAEVIGLCVLVFLALRGLFRFFWRMFHRELQ